MTIDQGKVGNVAARLMEMLENKYGDDAEITAVMLLVSVDHSDGTQDTIEFAPSEGISQAQGIGMLELVKRSLLPG